MDEKLLKELYAMPDNKHGQKLLQPTEEQKKHLLALWNTRHKDMVAKALGVSTGVARRWYRELTNGK